jgi:hypothetical protein
MSISTTPGGGLGDVLQSLLPGGVGTDTPQPRRVAQAGNQAFAHFTLIFDDGKGDHIFARP